MKKYLLICTLASILISTLTFAQSPNSFKYQAVARDAAGVILTNKTIGIKISLIQTSVNGTAVYSETFTLSTNQFGLFNLISDREQWLAGIFPP